MDEISKGMVELLYTINGINSNVKTEFKSRGIWAANEIKTATREVLRGERSGRVYKKPGTHGKTKSKGTRKLEKDYGHKLRGGVLYRASAPGEAPAVRIGTLRTSFKQSSHIVKVEGNNMYVEAGVQSSLMVGDHLLGDLLDRGTKRIKARPFKDKALEMAMPAVRAIYARPYME